MTQRRPAPAGNGNALAERMLRSRDHHPDGRRRRTAGGLSRANADFAYRGDLSDLAINWSGAAFALETFPTEARARVLEAEHTMALGARQSALSTAGEHDVGGHEHPKCIVADERNLNKHADERERRKKQRRGEYRIQRTSPQLHPYRVAARPNSCACTMNAR